MTIEILNSEVEDKKILATELLNRVEDISLVTSNDKIRFSFPIKYANFVNAIINNHILA